MITTLRAALSVVLLAGFYLLALGLVAGLAAASLWLWQEHPGGAAVKLSLLAVVLAAGLVVALWKAARAHPGPPDGLILTADRAPDLWSTVDALAAAVGTRAPDEIRLVPEVNAAVSEDAKLLGLVGGRRTMYIGVPLVQAFTVAQLRSVLAHELGHYSNNHTRLGSLAHRGRVMIVMSVQQASGIPGWILRMYALLYILVEQAVSRRLEYEADQSSIRLAGRAAAASALRELPILSAAWGFYTRRYIEPGWERGYLPDDILGGFQHLLVGRVSELAALRSEAPDRDASRWDSHPPIADRIAVIEAQPDDGVVPDDRAAGLLIPNFDEAVRQLDATSFNRVGKTVLPWDEFTATTVLEGGAKPQADALLRAADRVAGAASPSAGTGLGLVLDLIAAGRAADLARSIAPHAESPAALEALSDHVGSAFAVAAVGAGVAGWRHSWSGPATLVDAQGEPLDFDELTRLAVNPSTVEQARTRLADLGINVAEVRSSTERADAVGADLLGGLANMKTAQGYVDVLILDRGLILVPGPKSTDNGKRRLVEVIEAAPVHELAERHRLIAYEEIATATIVKRVPVRVDLTLHSGEAVQLHHGWSGEELVKGSDDILRAALAPFVPEPAA